MLLYVINYLANSLPSVLWRCWLGGRKGIRPVKTEWWGAGMVICVERGADLHMAQLMPLPLAVSCFSEFPIVFTFLVPAHLGSPRQRAVKRVWVCHSRIVFRTGVSGWRFLLVLAHLGSPGQSAVKRVCVCVYVTGSDSANGQTCVSVSTQKQSNEMTWDLDIQHRSNWIGMLVQPDSI